MRLTQSDIVRGLAAVSRGLPSLRVTGGEYGVPGDSSRTHLLCVLGAHGDEPIHPHDLAILTLERVLGVRKADRFTVFTFANRTPASMLPAAERPSCDPWIRYLFLDGVQIIGPRRRAAPTERRGRTLSSKRRAPVARARGRVKRRAG